MVEAVDPWFLEPGDVILTRGNSKLARFIRWGESHGKDKARVNHAALCVEWPSTIVEASLTARRCNIWDYHKNDGILVYRPVSMSWEQVNEVVFQAEKWVGAKYPMSQLLVFMVDNKIFRGRNVLRKLLSHTKVVCSRLVALSFAVVGLDFGSTDPDPDDIDDFCRSHPEHYVLMYSQNMEGY